ncbi:hypothetical protein GpartN1_g5424.t1 [Galdieria partita]|uniref:Uncharacterized protein n=1 Tax=Galdieria partita TaxID=83374 RepID=A0A9C7PZ88_9RHOD|nr:hypothetical protein GpartN1_g5424.t1 [Galdieria partita]
MKDKEEPVDVATEERIIGRSGERKFISFRDVYSEGKEKPYLSGYAADKRAWIHEAFGSIAAFIGAALGGLLTLHRIEMYLLRRFPKQWVLHGFIAGPPTATIGIISSGLVQGFVRGCFPPKYVEKGPRWLESDSYAGLRLALIEKTPNISYTKQHYLQAVGAELSPTIPSYVGFFSCVGFPLAAYEPLSKKCREFATIRLSKHSQRSIVVFASSLNAIGLGLLFLCGLYAMPPFTTFLLKSRHVISETLEGVGFDVQAKYHEKRSHS